MSRARHNMEKECRAKGGRVGMVVSGNPDVLEEAHEKHARGGKVKKKRGMMAEGHKPAHRMDRPKRRASGGTVPPANEWDSGSKSSSSTQLPKNEFTSSAPAQILPSRKPFMNKSRTGYKSGGRVSGSDRNPFSSAHRSGKTGERSGGEPD